jgi:hypothetical protein
MQPFFLGQIFFTLAKKNSMNILSHIPFFQGKVTKKNLKFEKTFTSFLFKF